MKHLLLALFLIPLIGVAQDSLSTELDTVENQDLIFDFPEEMPEFPGGEQAMYKFIIANMEYPTMAKEAGIQGKVYIQFVIDTTGEVTDIQVIRGVKQEGGNALDREAIRVIRIMPKWKPGSINGKPVRVRFTLPINFSLH